MTHERSHMSALIIRNARIDMRECMRTSIILFDSGCSPNHRVICLLACWHAYTVGMSEYDVPLHSDINLLATSDESSSVGQTDAGSILQETAFLQETAGRPSLEKGAIKAASVIPETFVIASTFTDEQSAGFSDETMNMFLPNTKEASKSPMGNLLAENTDSTTVFHKNTSIPGMIGFRWLCHSWVVAFHCLRPLAFSTKFARNGDAGIFFVMSGAVTEIAWVRMMAKHTNRPSDPKSKVRWWLDRYKGFTSHRLFVPMLITLLISFIAYHIFPIEGGEGSYLMKYVYTFTLPLLERFDQDRNVWNPDPPIWFMHQLFYFWIIHPFLRIPLSKIFGKSTVHIVISLFLNILVLALVCVSLEDYAVQYSGWSFHPLPRFFQYVAGMWTGHSIIQLAKRQHLPKLPAPFENSWMKEILWLLTPVDLLYAIFIVFQSFGPERYSDEWKKQWVWRTIFSTPILMSILFFLWVEMIRSASFNEKHLQSTRTSQFDLELQPIESQSDSNLSADAATTSDGLSQVRETSREASSQRGSVENNGRRISVPSEGLPHSASSTAPSTPTLGKLSPKIIDAEQVDFWLILRTIRSRSLFSRMMDSRLAHRAATNGVHFFVYLLHYPLVWQSPFSKNPVAGGQSNVGFSLFLYFLALHCDTIFTRIQDMSMTAINKIKRST